MCYVVCMNNDLKTILNVPNLLTLMRMALLPIIIGCMYAGFHWSALILYSVAAITDFLDGYLARKLDAITPFGTFLDPISDKVFVTLLLIVLIDTGQLSGILILLPLIIITREFLISGLREFLGPKDVQVPVTDIAKWKTTLQMLALGFLIIAPIHISLLIIGWILITAAAAITAYTGFLYMQASWPHLIGDNEKQNNTSDVIDIEDLDK